MNKTDWYPPRIKPVREGVYEVKWPDSMEVRFCLWTNGFWATSSEQFKAAETRKFDRGDLQYKWWRGLAENPNEG